jgi:hypothetical protein
MTAISSTARSISAVVMDRRQAPLTFPASFTCTATWPIVSR